MLELRSFLSHNRINVNLHENSIENFGNFGGAFLANFPGDFPGGSARQHEVRGVFKSSVALRLHNLRTTCSACATH